MIPAFEKAEAIHALDRAGTVIGNKALCHEEVREGEGIFPPFLSGCLHPIQMLLHLRVRALPVPIWVGDCVGSRAGLNAVLSQIIPPFPRPSSP
jgi:hypothetical protein